MINNKNCYPNLLRIYKTSYKSTDAITYHIKYTTMKNLDHVKIDCENSFYFVFNNVDGYIEKSNENKYLVFAYTSKNKKLLEKYTKVWNEIKNQIKTIKDTKPIKYKNNFIKTKFETNENKILSIAVMVIAKSVFQEGNKYYPQILLHECVYRSVNKL